MTALDDGFGGYLVLFAAGFLATEIWRWLGLLVGSRLDIAGEVFQWVRAVATALVAGMVVRMLLFPAGAGGHLACRAPRRLRRRLRVLFRSQAQPRRRRSRRLRPAGAGAAHFAALSKRADRIVTDCRYAGKTRLLLTTIDVAFRVLVLDHGDGTNSMVRNGSDRNRTRA
jgi:hypothetical protein